MAVTGTTVAPEDWAARYRDARPRFEKLAQRFEGLITDLLNAQDIEVVQITSRAKAIESFLGKLKRKHEKYAAPLEEVTDLAGIRVVTYYLEDVNRVANLIKEEFNVDDARSVTKGREAPNTFGYQSTHLIIALNDNRSKLPEWNDLEGVWAEIQIRTATQHAWAAVEHKLGYKNPQNVTEEIARQLNRLSALFELADEQFSQVRKVTLNVERNLADAVEGGDLNIALDISSLEAYLHSSLPTLTGALKVARRTDWKIREREDPGDPRRRERDLRDLARTLTAVGVETIEQFERLLDRAAEADEAMAAVASTEIMDTSGAAHPNAEAYPEDILNVLVFLLTDAPDELVRSVYGGVTADAIMTAIRT